MPLKPVGSFAIVEVKQHSTVPHGCAAPAGLRSQTANDLET